jgi:NAD(P)-dependent dehydrogenase (short-subunit alcohol dehydrogenase family)
MKMMEKVVIVTGSSRGIGRALALAFAKEGANLIVNDRTNLKAASMVVHEIEAMGRQALLIKADVTQRGEVSQMVQHTLEKFGRIDVLINNAGTVTISPAEEFTEEDWDRDLDTNLKGVFLCSQQVGKAMIKQRRGNIINIASMLGKIAFPKHAAYCASKAGVIALTKVLAVEWAKYNIRVNAIAPGFIYTDMIKDMLAKGIRTKEEHESIIKKIPLGRLGNPDEIASLCVFLASEEAEYITGETVVIDGGWLAHEAS